MDDQTQQLLRALIKMIVQYVHYDNAHKVYVAVTIADTLALECLESLGYVRRKRIKASGREVMGWVFVAKKIKAFTSQMNTPPPN